MNMYTVLWIFLTYTLVAGQEISLSDQIKAVFAQKTGQQTTEATVPATAAPASAAPATAAPVTTDASSTNTLPTRFSNQPQGRAGVAPSKTSQSCLTADDEQGTCVPMNQCSGANYGRSFPDLFRIGDGPCSYLQICCPSNEPASVPQTTISPPVVTPKPKRPGCGWREPNGYYFKFDAQDYEAQFAEFSWMVAILRFFDLSPKPEETTSIRRIPIGGGSLIHPSVVLTAAHIVFKDDVYDVKAGEWDTNTEDEPFAFQIQRVASKVINEEYVAEYGLNDVALLFLAKPMDLTHNVGTACLPKFNKVTPAATRCFTMGWGQFKLEDTALRPNILKKIEVPVVDRITCRTLLRKTYHGKYFVLHPSFMCAGGEGGGKDACKGDGGSSLVCPIPDVPERYEQSGIVTWGVDCGMPNIPGVYVDVAKFRDWIDKIVIQNGYTTTFYEY